MYNTGETTIKHDRYLDELCEKLEAKYDFLYKNIPLYSRKGRRIAEIDLLAQKDNHFDVYEVKCSYRIIKAKRQLNKIKKLVPKVKGMFFFCGESGSLEDVA